MEKAPLSIAIPTLDRGAILLKTIESLLGDLGGGEVLVVDQTKAHPEEIERQLGALSNDGAIRWIRLSVPSIPYAMNVALREASSDVVLFLDDDIIPGENLVSNHLANYVEPEVVAVAGQVIQPWQSPADVPRPKPRPGIWEDLDFPFHSTNRSYVRNCMAGNFSVRRDAAFAAGGFDENFIGAAHRFETEFCRRLIKQPGKIVFEPRASVRHLKHPEGGIRAYGQKFQGNKPAHYISDYYYALKCGATLEAIHYILYRLCQVTCRRSLLERPWRLPAHLWCQVHSIVHAKRLSSNREKSEA